MPSAQTVIFHEPKAGNAAREWEDCAGVDGGDPAAGRDPRFIVVDGATEAYDAVRWVGQLVASFLGLHGDVGPADLSAVSLDGWFGRMQQQWVEEAPATFTSVFEELKFHEEGSFATFLGCVIQGLDGPTPGWTAAALGDAVLFQVRDGGLCAQFPELAAADFGLNPDGIFTQPAARGRMQEKLLFAAGRLQVGDVVFAATDALAAWIVGTSTAGGSDLWDRLTTLEHPAEFRRLIAELRRSGALKNDDVTLLRMEFIPSVVPDFLMVDR